MRFCGVELTSIHPAISIAKEIRPGMPAREVLTAAGTDGETVVGTKMTQGEYRVRVNIAGKTRKEAWDALAELAAWANAAGRGTGVLEPTHWPGKAYHAIASDIEPPEFRFGFGTVEVTFVIPRPVAFEVIQSVAGGVEEAVIQIGGTSTARPTVEITVAESEDVTLRMDDKIIFHMQGTYLEGQVVKIDFAKGTVSIDGAEAEKDIDFSNTRWRPGFTPGRHVLQSPGAKAMAVRWHNEWV